MEIQSATEEKGSVVAYLWGRLKGVPGKLKAKLVGVAKSIKKLGQDDPRRVIHSLKVGLALTLVSLLYYLRPLYNGFGASGIWAVLTVVVVFEFTVGATVSKCLNRGFATLLAGGLGVGAQYLANFFGEQGEPIVLGIVVFLLGAAATFSRFFPRIKARYDYGVVIFILTFSLVTVSGYRVDNISQLFDQRLLTIIIGVGMCMIIAIFLCPVWAGEDLHNLVALNLEKLANYLEGFGGEYFLVSQEGESIVVMSKDDKSFLQGYKSVLNSKSTEDSLANFARWEPGHGRFQFNHPWKQYLNIGALTRQCAYQIEALNSYINSAHQAPEEFLRKIKESCTKVSSESSKALKVISSAIKTMKDPSSANYHVENSESAIQDLKIALQATFLEESDLLAVIPVATVASILIEIVTCVEEIVESVHELSQLAHFKGAKESAITPEKPMLLHRGSINPILDVENADVVIAVDETSLVSPEKGNLEAPITSRRVEV